MNETLLKAIQLYATATSDELLRFLNGLSKPTLIGLFTDLLTFYMNDKNSSKLRELITAVISGYEFSTEKLGYNGYKTVAPDGVKVFCEIKPKNIDNCNKKKLNGGGSFNDYTPERFEKDLKENLNIVVSGFVRGKLVYILEFPFACLKDCIELKLKKRFGESMHRRSGEYLRSASFSFKNYKNCPRLKAVYVNPKISQFEKCLSRELYSFLKRASHG